MSVARWTRAGWWLLPVILALLLSAPSVVLPGDGLGIRRFQTPPIGPSLRISQTFSMTGDGLHAIEVLPVAPAERAAGDVRFELYEVRNDQLIPVRIAQVLADEVLDDPSYRFEFVPIPDSRDRVYRLDLVAAPAQVAFWATRGDRYEGGSLHANGRERWADLAFRTYAPAPPIWNRFLALGRTNPVRAYAAGTALVLAWLLLGVVLRTLPTLTREPATLLSGLGGGRRLSGEPPDVHEPGDPLE